MAPAKDADQKNPPPEPADPGQQATSSRSDPTTSERMTGSSRVAGSVGPAPVSIGRIVIARLRHGDLPPGSSSTDPMAAIVVKAWGPTGVNIKAFPDGPNGIHATLWGTSYTLNTTAVRPEDLKEGEWMWPPRG